jgi:hypothetical protein
MAIHFLVNIVTFTITVFWFRTSSGVLLLHNGARDCRQLCTRRKNRLPVDLRKATSRLLLKLRLINSFTFIWPRIVINFFTIKLTDALISNFFFWSETLTCFGQFLCPSSGVIHCTFGTGTCYTLLTTASVQDHDGTAVPSWLCTLAVVKPV